MCLSSVPKLQPCQGLCYIVYVDLTLMTEFSGTSTSLSPISVTDIISPSSQRVTITLISPFPDRKWNKVKKIIASNLTFLVFFLVKKCGPSDKLHWSWIDFCFLAADRNQYARWINFRLKLLLKSHDFFHGLWIKTKLLEGYLFIAFC